MCAKLFSKILTVGLITIVATCIIHISHTRNYQMGREAYLVKETANYDRHFSHPDSIVGTSIASLFFIAVFYGVYELIGFATFKVVNRNDADGSNIEQQAHC
jgi:hypothetical protein